MPVSVIRFRIRATEELMGCCAIRCSWGFGPTSLHDGRQRAPSQGQHLNLRGADEGSALYFVGSLGSKAKT